MALFKLSEVSEEERKKYLQSIGIDADKFQKAQESKITSNQKSENILPIEKSSNTAKLPIEKKNNTDLLPIKQKSENNTVINKKLSEMVQGPNKEINNSQNRFNFRQANQTANKNENKQLNAKVTTEKEKEQIKESGGLEYDTNAIKEAMEINKDNSKGNLNSSISHVLSGVLEGAKSNFAGVGQSALFPIANALRMAEEVTGKKQQAQEKDNEEDLWSNKVLDMADYLKEESQHHSKVGSMLENNITRDLGNVSNTIGNMAMSAISNIAIPSSGILETGISAGGNSAGETLNEDRSNLIQAIATGTAKGAVEGFTEKITGGNILGKGSLDDLAENIIGNKIKSKAGKKLASKMYEFGGEILEEQISNNAGYIIDKIINNKDLPDFQQWLNESNETTKSTFLTTLALNMLGMGGSTYNDSQSKSKDTQAQKYLNEAQKIIDNENIAENIKNNVTNQYNYKNTILNNLNTSNLSDKTKTELQQYLKENQITEEQYNQINETLQQEKMSKEEQSSVSDNEMKYQYIKSDNAKVNQLRQDVVNNNWDNSKETNNFVNFLEKIVTDKDVEIRLDTNLKDNEGNVVNGSYKDGVITINPNSDRSGEFLAVHELTHAIGTDEMRNMVQKYRESNSEFNNAVEKLLGTYKVSELNDEALADISGQLFSSQDFINNVSNTNPSFFRKIYNEIKYLWHQFRGYKNQNQFVDDLYYKWTEAYNSNNKLNDTTNYHISENFSDEIDKALKNELPSNTQIKARDFTPKILVDSGVQDLPMLITQKHIKSTIYTQQEAQALGLQTKNVNYHGLGKELLIKAIDNLDSPQAIYKTSENNYLVVTEFKDNNGKEIIVPIQINGNGRYNDVFIDENQIKSVYGRNNLDNYINKNNFEQIYKKNKELDFNEGIQYSNVANSSIDNSIASQDEDVNTTTKYSKQESENNSDSFNLSENEKITKTINELENELSEAQSFLQRGKIKEQIRALKEGFDNVQDYREAERLRKEQAIEEYHREQEEKKKETEERKIAQKELLKKEIEEAPENKKKQYEIIQSTNPMEDDYHVGIRSPKDIKTFAEVINDDINDDESFAWGDFSKKDAERALKKGSITVYSSKPIENGNFVSTSKIQATEYAGGEKIYTKEVPIEDVAWINGDEGQYAKISTKYSKENSTWREYLESHFQSTGTRTDMSKLPIDNKIIENRKQQIINKAQQIEKTNPDFQGLTDEIKNSYLGEDFDYNTYKQMNNYLDTLQPVKKENNQVVQILPTNKVERIYENTPGEEVNYTEMERPNGKIRKHYRSIIESSNTTAEAKKIAKELMGVDTYVKTSNKYNTEIADRNIETNGPEKELTSLTTNVNDNKKITAVDIATGERLIEYFSKIGDKDRLQEAIQTTAMAGTEAGQAVQAMSLLNHQTPQGQVVWIQRSIDKVNKDLARRNKNGAQFDFTPEMQQKILNSTKENLQDNINQVYEELGKQVPKSHIEQLNEWRYFCMLANPKTHIRNIVGNLVMGKVQDTKNKIAGGLESVFLRNSDERNHTIKRASKEVRQFAKNDIKNVESELGLNDNKYNPKSRLQNAQRTFKSNILENTLGKAFDFNSKLLEAEDGIGLKSAYPKALAEYITANKLDIKNISDKDLQKARNYAIRQAQEATFHQECQIASMINTIENKNNATRVIFGGLFPFKKTPINVAITGYQYSPVGLGFEIVRSGVALRQGKITANQYIDNISKGLTGTGIALVGFALTEAGILKASGGDDDDKEAYEEQQGKQSYSIQIGDNTYSLDWLAPAGIPLFIGSEFSQLLKAGRESGEVKNQNQFISSLENVANAGLTAMNPMSEMSMVSGLVSTLKSYSQDPMQGLSNTLVNMGKSYVNQMFPTALGQVSKTLDDKERSTTSTESGILSKAVDSTKNQIISKIPGLRQMLPVATDVWGNEKEQKGNYIDNAILPWTKKEITTNSTDKALTELYDKTGESSVLPDSYINKTLTYDKQKYRLTDQEYAELKKEYGKTSYAIVSGLTSSKAFNKMSQEQQVKAISEAYKYSKAKIKSTYANWNDIDNEDSSVYKKVQDVIKNGGDAKDYFLYIGATADVKKDKQRIQILKNSNIGSKKAIYASTIGSDDKTYSILNNTDNFNINNYLDYKLQDFSSDKKDDGTVKGKTISGSGKTKFYNYMDDSNFTYEQKLLLTGMRYKTTNAERENIFNIINNFELSSKEKLKIMSKMQGFKVYNNGQVSF